ncbi:nitroreductase [Hoeflea prorocentri]|uniref:Nitroreductase n=1 Tax=Hoeflea prorocentri TaxID=1922333 RepID=A0A9X3ZGR5_9HYPH|nr:nitroreductase [Hoeflea prorocentri]MCY6380173.1 nitroreductase [Hoeflea prorocentri]MDA5397973.1 nitroreductase [Hoeflea prorocentri]
MNVSDALTSRIACRAFKPDPVPEETVRTILETARQAPSGGNLQPWHVYVLSGASLSGLIADVGERSIATPRGAPTQYEIYPKSLKEPYSSRRFKCGEDLYATLGISREDKAGRVAQFMRNYAFFGAPVGLFIYLDRTMGPPQWADTGIFLQSIMLLAREYGLHTCPQEAWAVWHEAVSAHLDPPDEWMLFCGMALGYMDEDAPVNTLRTERAGVSEFATFLR